MSNSKLRMMVALTMLAATSGNLFDSDSSKEKAPKRKLKYNETKKCFRAECTNHRTGDSLYCSDECQQVYHKYLKEKESQS